MTEPETLPDQPQDDATAPEAETGDDVQVAFDVGDLPGGARGAIEAVLMIVEEPVTDHALSSALELPVEEIREHLGALEEAYADAVAESAAAHDGFFAGLPSFVKDNSDVAGLPTRHGSALTAAAPVRLDRAEQAAMLEPFVRGDRARNLNEASGFGLGLSIVAALVAAHGGRVGVDTSPGVGATFWVRLPLAEAD